MRRTVMFAVLVGIVALLSACTSNNAVNPLSEASDVPCGVQPYPESPKPLVAGATDSLPNLAEAFPTEKLIISHREGAIEWYLYESEVEFNDLKKTLLRVLGPGWVEADDAFSDAQESASAGFVNPRYPTTRISLHVRWTMSPSTRKYHVAHILKSDSAKLGSRKITYTALLRSLAESGNLEAQSRLGFAYFTGNDVPKDVSEALMWWRKAAEQNHAFAQFALGYSYYFGRGVETNYAEAVKWYRKAADQNNSEAEYGLGVCYDKGQGVTQDRAEALNWYRKAAEHGHAKAQLNLGVTYHLGEGLQKNDLEAYAWCSLAAKTDSHAAACRDALEKAMTPNELASARKRIEELESLIKAKSQNNGRPK